jgi:hypothetical protein
VPRGAYHFVYWCRPAHEQAAWFRRTVPADPNALPPVLDLEWNGHSRSCPRTLDKETALEKVRLMLREMEAHTGKRPIIYTDITFHKDVLEGELRDYPHWLRSVAAEPQERYVDREWMMWQYTTTGRVPGINGDVDRNAFSAARANGRLSWRPTATRATTAGSRRRGCATENNGGLAPLWSPAGARQRGAEEDPAQVMWSAGPGSCEDQAVLGPLPRCARRG